MRSDWLTLALLIASGATPGKGGAPAGEPDLGNARAYFNGIELRPASFQLTGRPAGNIVWIVIDALRPDHLGTYGYHRPTTPHLDELAKESFVFLHAYANAPWTRPSTASMLTGLFPSQHRTQTDKSRLPAEVRTIAEDLRTMGYATAAVVANGNGSSIAGLDRGFEHYVDPANHFKKLPAAEEVYAQALQWLGSRPKGRPFFLFVFVVDPHDPYRAPPEYEKRWLGEGAKPLRRTAHWEYQNDYPEPERRAMLSLYDAAIRYTDDQTGKFLAELEKLGLGESTSLLVTADHGDGFGEHGYYLHGHHHYDEIIRVPLLIRTPAWQGAGHVFHLVQAVDLLPTLVTAAGGRPRPGLGGRDIGAMLAEPADPARVALSEYNAFGIRRSALVSLKYRVILQLPADREAFLARIPKLELLPSVSFDSEVLHVYDRQADPAERRNLAPDRLPPATSALVSELRRHMQSGGAPSEAAAEETVPAGIRENLRSLGYVQ
ncbi:MAG: sulfatase [Myxococcales bacterium]|nr:sulfatase [Myxococcales bacterium]